MEVIGKVEVARGATINLDAGKTLGWAGATPLLGAFGCPKESWGRSSPANREALCLRSVLPVSSEGKEEQDEEAPIDQALMQRSKQIPFQVAANGKL